MVDIGKLNNTLSVEPDASENPTYYEIRPSTYERTFYVERYIWYGYPLGYRGNRCMNYNGPFSVNTPVSFESIEEAKSWIDEALERDKIYDRNRRLQEEFLEKHTPIRYP